MDLSASFVGVKVPSPYGGHHTFPHHRTTLSCPPPPNLPGHPASYYNPVITELHKEKQLPVLDKPGSLCPILSMWVSSSRSSAALTAFFLIVKTQHGAHGHTHFESVWREEGWGWSPMCGKCLSGDIWNQNVGVRLEKGSYSTISVKPYQENNKRCNGGWTVHQTTDQ